MHIRKTTPGDLDRIMDILAEGRAALAALGIDQWQGGYPHRGVVEADVQRGESFAVLDDDGMAVATMMVSLAGEAIYNRIEDGAWLTASTSANPRYAVVHRVAVGSACKGQGAGAFMLSCAEDRAREHGCESVRVDTHPGNLPMQRLLEKCGYRRCGIVHIEHAEEHTPERIAFEKLV